jgi:uncharacterized protein YidB (DUF937 family)
MRNGRIPLVTTRYIRTARMSGIFGSILGSLMSSGALQQALPGILTQLVGTGQGMAGGGLPALLQQLETAGLGEQVRSWIGNGPNQPVSAGQLADALPPQQVQGMAAQAGTTPENLLEVLAHTLPHAVDHATPNGEVPPPDQAPQLDLGGLVGRMLGR